MGEVGAQRLRGHTPVSVAAIDLGASSGRVMLGEVGADRLRLTAAARFANGPVRRDDGLHWDVSALHRHAIDGLRSAAAAAPSALASVGIDSWAVDYGLLRDGRLLDEPFHYRDEERGAVGPGLVHAVVPPEELYARNGLQFLPFNTVYQLAADHAHPGADRLLLVPDLLAHWLTGAEVAERTNASTTGLLDLRTGAWDDDVLSRLGISRSLLADLVEPGTTIGTLLPEVGEAVGAPGLPVVAVGSHDTASAVVGVPMAGDEAAYVSLGTWGLVGLELTEPVLTEEARAANFTHEGGVDGTIRFLTNVMGTWLLSETLRTWGRDDLGALLAAAADVTGEVPLFDVQDPRFVPPGDMPARIAAWCAEHDVAPPVDAASLVRSVVESLAVAYADALATAASLTGRTVRQVHVVGGGSQNALLCQALADRTGLPVVAGPVEATALGNVLVQGRAAGAISGGLDDLRALIARTQDLRRHEPREVSVP
ncbi:rhamnulokinase family protein [Nocardioides sp. S-58]|uniref:Rhamnulokinase family protein n=1 Tax=Nocardioides renjunii TaxID=3095075 RepID=A0ABU5K997_9ACTN|nr:rhamnulokinase family protein [Nocardioides sp. S-58]MDZ5661543.1 rhamnulokinase family protein [Nocardioides sp. S-58]